MLVDDRNLSRDSVQSLSSAEAVASLFAHLGYNVEVRRPQTASALNITNVELMRQIQHAERLAADETDMIHDLLAFLAEQMIDLNKRNRPRSGASWAGWKGRLARRSTT